MDMDENGRNERKWHLAQQLAQHVIMQKTTIHIACNQMHIITSSNNVIALSHRYELGGIFISLISIKIFPHIQL